MPSFTYTQTALRIALLTLLVALAPSLLMSHCDTMNGPVVAAAREALKTGDVNLVLIWVQKDDEAVIRDVFNQTLAVRKLSPEAAALADMHFFETLVRVHRAGEGVAYTGLKPADVAPEPGIEAADKALASGSTDELLTLLDEAIHRTVTARHREVMERRNFPTAEVDAGRGYVRAYVEFIHYVERLHEAATQPAEGHAPAAAPAHAD